MTRSVRHVSLLRWSARDLRSRWTQVLAIALIIGVGSGTYSGLSSSSPWRYDSYDASYRELAMYDLRVAFEADTYVDTETLLAAADAAAFDPVALQPRLRTPIQVDASTDDETILVPGELVSVQPTAGPGSDGRKAINQLHTRSGRELTPADADHDVVAVDEHFADEYGIEAPTTFTVTGGVEVDVVARALAPEYFMITGSDGGLLAQANHAVLFAPLETVQRISGRQDQVTDLLVRLAPGADTAQAAAALDQALSDALPDAPFEVLTPADDEVHRLLYDDIEGDQRFFNIFAILILAGAAFAAFNLTGRILEAQRREFGIGMALGVPTSRLATRPLLVGIEVALLGVVAGVGVGLVLQAALGRLWGELFPLPVWRTGFEPAVFLRGAALGFVLPLVASILPLRRTLRMAPVDAIRTGHRTPTSGLAPKLARRTQPGSTVAQMPIRNVLRAPRRTLLTALGIGASIAVLVGVMGLIDSLISTVDLGEADIVGQEPDRVNIDLDFFYPVDSPEVAAATDPSLVERAEAGLRLPGSLGEDAGRFDVLIQTIDVDSDLWRPGVLEGELSAEAGVVISEKASADLDVGVGDTVALRHPLREGLGYDFVDTDLPVLAVHANPYRFLVYVDTTHADLFGLEGITNSVRAVPTNGITVEEVQRAMFVRDGVASVQPVSRIATSIRDRLEETIGLFDIVQVVVLVLALLIAFNSSSINMDERAREHATMFAFGLPLRSVVGTSVVEAALTGLIGTLFGLLTGRLLLGFLVRVLIPETFPDLGIIPMVAPSTLVTALVLGVIAVAAAPLLTVRKLSRMDLPATLRVVE